MADTTAKYAKNIVVWREAVAKHDHDYPDHGPAYGIGVTWFDLDRLGMEEGEELWPGVSIFSCGGVATGQFEVLCPHDPEGSAEISEAVSTPTPAVSTVYARAA